MSLLASGCATWQLPVPGYNPYLQYLAEALGADARGREGMWAATRSAPPTENNDVHIALLQSVPGHSGYDPAAAESHLQALLAKHASDGVGNVARVQLAQLRQTGECRREAQNLRERLAQMVNIERNLKEGH